MQNLGVLLGFLAGILIRFKFSSLEETRKQFYLNVQLVMEKIPPYGLFFLKEFLEIVLIEAIFFGIWGLLLGSWMSWPNPLALYLIYWVLVPLRRSTSEEKLKMILEQLAVFMEFFLDLPTATQLHQGWIAGNLIAWLIFTIYVHRHGLLEVPKIQVREEDTVRGQMLKMVQQAEKKKKK